MSEPKQKGISAGRGRGRPILGQGASSQPPVPGQIAADTQHQTTNLTPQISTLSVNAAVFVPRKPVAPPVPTCDPVAEVREAIQLLTQKPAEFDNTLPPLTAKLSATVLDEAMLIQIVEEIVSQGISLSNFRYSAARICEFFSHNFEAQFASGNFRQHLLKRCHSEHCKREAIAQEKNGMERLISFTLFMGELLLNMTTASGDRMKILGNAVNDLLSLMLSNPSETTLKCVVQSLKLTGAILEETESNNNEDKSTPNMDVLIGKIKTYIVDGDASKRLKRMLLSVVELRAGNWDRATEKETASQPEEVSDAVLYGGVYYGDNGQTYTYEDTNYYGGAVAAEEEAVDYFASEGTNVQTDDGSIQTQSWYTYDDDGNTQPWSSNDGEMDEVEAAAYEDFLYMQETERNNAANNY